jgi:hypothetical protein
MYRTRSPLILVVLAVALVAVPAAFAKGRDHRALRVKGTCTEQSTSKLKVKRDDRRLEVEFEVDQNRVGVPWTVTLSRNGATLETFTRTTRAPSGSFEVHRRIAGRLGTDTIKAVATRASGETCTAAIGRQAVTAQAASPAGPAVDDNGGRRHGGDDGGSHS